PRDQSAWQLTRQLMLNAGAMIAVAFLAAALGEQLARAGQRLARQEAAALDLAALNDDIIRCLTSGLLTIDREGNVLTVNDAAGDILQVNGPEAIGHPVNNLLPSLSPILEQLGDLSAAKRVEIAAKPGGRELSLG